MTVRIIGTSHIAKQSQQEIKKAVAENHPDVIAVELDVQRASALFEEGKTKLPLQAMFQIGLKGYLFAKVGQYIQQKLGKIVGTAPGSDMKTALELAKKENISVAFIDQPIQVTLRKFSQQLTWREKGRFVIDIIKGLLFPKKQLQELGLRSFDLHTVPEEKLIESMMNVLKKRYPSVYKVLVEDRNRYMVKQLVILMREHPEKKILVVVGAGHKKGMEELLNKIDIVH
ncbi:MAG: TraB/GumN family protein [Nanoarchaeota archaeon]